MKLYYKYKEVILYIFFGGLTFVFGLVTYFLFERLVGLNELIANILSWIVTVLFAFITNQKWVFGAKTSCAREYFEQMIRFYSGRFATLIIEEIILYVFITWQGFDSMYVKVVAQIIVIILNYIISKKIIFNTESSKH